MRYSSGRQAPSDEQCPLCGSRGLCEPKESDPAPLCSAGAFRAQVIEGIRSEDDIPY